jgi:hypothetical protein
MDDLVNTEAPPSSKQTLIQPQPTPIQPTTSDKINKFLNFKSFTPPLGASVTTSKKIFLSAALKNTPAINTKTNEPTITTTMARSPSKLFTISPTITPTTSSTMKFVKMSLAQVSF